MALGVAGLITAFYLREAGSRVAGMRMGLIAIRLTVVAILCFMIAQVALSLDATGLPYLVIAVDDSASMGIVDRYDDPQINSLAEREVRGGRVRQGHSLEPGQIRTTVRWRRSVCARRLVGTNCECTSFLMRPALSLTTWQACSTVFGSWSPPARPPAWARVCVAF